MCDCPKTVLFESDDELNTAAYHMFRQPGPMRARLKAFVTWLKQVAKADSDGPDLR